MPHATVKLRPGVDQNRTPTLNEAAISTTQLVRFVPDKENIGLVQKLGGWTKFFATAIQSTVRALTAWEDTNAVKYLGLGCESSSASGQGLLVISNDTLKPITPKIKTTNPSISITTVAGSPYVTINDPLSNVDSNDSVYIQTQISVGGLVLFGLYQCLFLGSTQYRILVVDDLGNPKPATSSVTGGVDPIFTFALNSASVNVQLPNHGLSVGDIFPVIVPVNNVTAQINLYGNYNVVSVVNANNFTINASSVAQGASSTTMNGGLARFEYFITENPAPASTGYGVGGYGEGGYGIGTPAPPVSSASPISASDWTLDNWGNLLISCPVGGQIYQWDPISSATTNASVIPEAPIVSDGMFVAMPQRQIIAWGSSFTGIQDPLLINWCDVENFNSWIPNVTNHAGAYRIPKGSRIVGCIQGPQQGLVWTDLGLWAMQYSGPPYVYQFNEIGAGCGLIARKAATTMNGSVYWMGQSQFFVLGPSGVQTIPCQVWDVIFQDLDQTNLDKIRVAANSNFGEVAWYYPTKSNGGEINAYVKYNVNLNQWDFGTLTRTAWINQSVLGPPIGAYIFPSSAIDGYSSFIYQHETSTDADGAAMLSSFQTGYFSISDGEWKVFVDQIWPDMKWGYYEGAQNANVLITFYVADYPGTGVSSPAGGVRQYGPYNMTRATTFLTPRFRGRLMSIKIESDDIGTFWRIGAMRYRFEPDGKF